MHIQVYFTPAELRAVAAPLDDIYIVIDMIRATTSLAVMFERGAARVYVAGTVEQARAAREKYPDRLLCGERNVKPLPGFDYGNSPVQFAQADLSGRELVMTTTNGTRAFYACPKQSICFAGSFYNGRAVAQHALSLALAQHRDIALVCSGELDYFALDDVTCAGYLARQLLNLHAGPLELEESVEAALALYETFKPPKIMHHCDSARSVIEGGLIDDVYFCMRQSESECIPVVVGKEEDTGLWVLEHA